MHGGGDHNFCLFNAVTGAKLWCYESGNAVYIIE